MRLQSCLSKYTYISVVPLSFVLLANILNACSTLDPSKALVWGPGVENGNFNLPVQYFFVQLVNSDGSNSTAPSSKIQFELKCGDKITDCHAKTDIVVRQDGSFIIRYRLLEGKSKYSKLVLRLSCCDGRPVGNGEYLLKRATKQEEECICPQEATKWTKDLGCSETLRTLIQQDLAPWKNGAGNFTNLLRQARRRYYSAPRQITFCHYRIRQNKIYRKYYGPQFGFRMYSDAALLALSRMVQLADTEFLWNLGDYPLTRRESGAAQPPLPALTWSATTEAYDVALPTYELTSTTLNMLNGTSLDILSAQGMRVPPWADKIDTGFFRGRDSSKERLDLVLMSREQPDDLDAGITKFHFFFDEKHLYEPTVAQIPFRDFFKYRYVITVDGTVAAYRLGYLLAGNSLILKQDSPYFEHYYRLLQPWVHYVPLRRHLTDVFEKIQWARENEEKVVKIIKNANRFVEEFLQPSQIFCYHLMLLQEYSKKQLSESKTADPNMELVNPRSGDIDCCQHSTNRQQFREEL